MYTKKVSDEERERESGVMIRREVRGGEWRWKVEKERWRRIWLE